MTNYIEYKFKVTETEPWNEIIIATISELPFESFVENEEGFDAYIPSNQENEAEIKEVLFSLENVDFTFTRKEIELEKIKLQAFEQETEKLRLELEHSKQLLIETQKP